jgi:serine/threonine-protein kinase
VFWVIYVAAEPHIRRGWPDVLVSLTRLVDGQWRDSLVGRDIGMGLAVGAALTAITRATIAFNGAGVPHVPVFALEALRSPVAALGWALHVPSEALVYAINAVFLLLLGRIYIRIPAIYIPLFALICSLAVVQRTGSLVADIVIAVMTVALLIGVLLTGGVLAAAAAWTVHHLLDGIPLTLDGSAWFAGRGWVIFGVVIVIAANAFLSTVQRGRTLASAPAAT